MMTAPRDTERDGRSGTLAWQRARRSVTRLWREVRSAAAFLTVLPGPATASRAAAADAGFLVGAMPLFPVIGAAVGGAAGIALIVAAGLGLPPLAAAFVAVAILVAVTGALHEDGLGDVADGFGGGRSRDDKLRIMRDSRVGTYGVIAIVLSLGLRAAALAALPAVLAAAALVAAAALSRATLPAIMHWLPSARSAGMAAEAGRPQIQAAVIAAALGGLMAIVAVGPGIALVAAVSTALGAAAVALLAREQIGGHTGDVCGAAQQTAEVAALLAIVACR